MSLFKKIKSVAKNGIKPIQEGKNNFINPKPLIEQNALKRAEKCLECKNYSDEPIDMFKVVDERVPELSKKMCDGCGCPLSYLLRQNIKICKKWDEDEKI